MKDTFFPSEWHRQSGVQLTWPHAGTDWDYMLDEVQECFICIANEISRHELLLIVTPEPDKVRNQLKECANIDNIRFFHCETNDTWARDHGGITVFEDGIPHIHDFSFNGWGMKFAADKDNQITRKAFRAGLFNGEYVNSLDFVFEGGSIESDGQGTLLTTSECLLSPNRNDHLTRKEIEARLKSELRAEHVLWLEDGFLAGDDTDSHVDTLARLCPDDTIVYVQCPDKKDEHYDALQKMERQLHSFRNKDGKPFRLLPLPMADAIMEDGERLPATYANFLIINDAVLYPTYAQPDNDREAANVLAQAFPDREIVGIDCRALIKQHGSLHCVTMQYPAGVLK